MDQRMFEIFLLCEQGEYDKLYEMWKFLPCEYKEKIYVEYWDNPRVLFHLLQVYKPRFWVFTTFLDGGRLYEYKYLWEKRRPLKIRNLHECFQMCILNDPALLECSLVEEYCDELMHECTQVGRVLFSNTFYFKYRLPKDIVKIIYRFFLCVPKEFRMKWVPTSIV
jgi:hypothetical protein